MGKLTGNIKDITGQKFNKLTAISYEGKDKWSNALWKFECDCGNEKIITASSVRSGNTLSCGCHGKEKIKQQGYKNLQDLIGKNFGRLTVLKRGKTSKNRIVYWICKCDCGKEVEVAGSHLKSGHTKSCGCLQKENIIKSSTTHNMTKHRLYRIYHHMVERCYNKNDKNFFRYGGRGITVCKEWLENKEAFFEWALNNGYQENLTIDRMNVNGNYEPLNCKFSTAKEQANNTRRNRYVTIDNITRTFSQWCEFYNIKYNTAHARLRNGWNEIEALQTP